MTSREEALERCRQALAGKPEGKHWRQDDRFDQPVLVVAHVGVQAADILTIAEGLEDHDDIVAALVAGCRAGRPDRMVVVLADDLRHLLRQGGAHATAAARVDLAGPATHRQGEPDRAL